MTTFRYPKVTIITVTYNAAATLANTIKSILNQVYPSLEYIIIDGKSSDETVEIIKHFQHRLAYWVSEVDQGIYDAMNKGILASKGDWVIFIGADDLFNSDNVLLNMFTEKNLEAIDFLYGDVILKTKKKIYGGSRTYAQLIEKNINHQSIFYNKRIFDKMGLFKLRYKILSDYEFNLQVFRDQSVIKMYVPGVISIYYDKGRSNKIIDGNFYMDQLEHFINVENLLPEDYRLQTYFFFYGFALLLKNKRIMGAKNLLHSLTTGKRKYYYFLVSIKYTLSLLGLFSKMSASMTLEKEPAEFLNRSK